MYLLDSPIPRDARCLELCAVMDKFISSKLLLTLLLPCEVSILPAAVACNFSFSSKTQNRRSKMFKQNSLLQSQSVLFITKPNSFDCMPQIKEKEGLGQNQLIL